jgi:hypothetical protein
VSFCTRCGSDSYGSRSAFCTRCGANLIPSPSQSRYYNAPPAPRTGWKSLPFVVRVAIYAISSLVLFSVGFWLLIVLAIFGPH